MNQIVIKSDTGEVDGSDISFESLKIKENLCTEPELRFGSCEAGTIAFRLRTMASYKDKKISITFGIDEQRINFKNFRVVDDKPTADKVHRDITAYDAMYDILNAEVSSWYNFILPDANSSVTLKVFRESFLSYMGIEFDKETLANDNMTVTRTIDPQKLSGKTVITCICELNGCFGKIGRDGRFKNVILKQMYKGLVPSEELTPSETLYPADPGNVEEVDKAYYTSCQYEDFETECISKVQIRTDEDDIGCIYGAGDNCYIIQDNFLVYGKSDAELQEIAKNFYDVVKGVSYKPATVEAKGNPFLEVGDGIQLFTTYEVVQTYILSRTLTGIQALTDTYTAEGVQRYSEEVNSTREQIIQLKGKTAKIVKSVDKLQSTVTDLEKSTSSRFTQTAEKIELEVKRASEVEGNLSAAIKVASDQITAEVKRASGAEGNLSAAIKVASDQIAAEVKRASDVEGNLSSKITQTAESISTKVSKNNIISEINQSAEQITIKAGKIDLDGLVSATQFTSKYATIESLNATNLAVSGKASIGDLNSTNATVNGKLDASTFNAKMAEIDTLIAGKIDAGTVKAEYMEVTNWTSGGYIKANKIDAQSLASILANVDFSLTARNAVFTNSLNYKGTNVKWQQIKVGTVTYAFLVAGT